MEDFINQKLEKIREGFEFSQIRSEVFQYLLNKHCTLLRLDSIIENSMELYSEIIFRYLKDINANKVNYIKLLDFHRFVLEKNKIGLFANTDDEIRAKALYLDSILNNK
jgi:hypothetical protein